MTWLGVTSYDRGRPFNGGMTSHKYSRLRSTTVVLAALFCAVALIASGCDGMDPSSSASLDSTGAPLAGVLPTPTSTPDQGPTDPGSQALPAGSYPTTNVGGYFTVSQTRSLALDSGGIYMGAASVGTQFYILERVSSGGVTRLKILSTPDQPGTGVASWTVACNILADTSSQLGFTADAIYFYLPGSISSDLNHDQYLRRIRKSDCAEVSAYDVGQSLLSSGYNYFFSVNAGLLYFASNQSALSLTSWNMANGLSSNQSVAASLGGVNLSYVESMYVDTNYTWVLTYAYIWKFDHSGNPIAWGALPDDSNYYLEDARAVVSVDANTLVILTNGSGTMTRYFLDVSHF